MDHARLTQGASILGGPECLAAFPLPQGPMQHVYPVYAESGLSQDSYYPKNWLTVASGSAVSAWAVSGRALEPLLLTKA